MTGSPSTQAACSCGNTDLPPDARFCHRCGATVAAAPCPACGTPLAAGARFCHRCGHGIGSAAPAPAQAGAPAAPMPNERNAWLTALGVIVVLLALMIWKAWSAPGTGAPVTAAAAPAAPFAGGGGGPGGGSPPDISKMTPKERFERLFNRVMEAGSRGDSTTVINFSPMAIGAYQQLPAPDNGDRFDAALLHLQVGQLKEASALADTIRRGDATNLLAPVIVATVARIEQKPEVEKQAFERFRTLYDKEMASAKPEYALRKAILDGFIASAKAAK